MMKLLRAGFDRLRRNRLFRILICFSILIALVMVGSQYNDMLKYGDVIGAGQVMLNYSVMIGLVIAVFASLFLGVEYSDGTVRNKISTGHKRSDIYLSNLLIVSGSVLVSYLVFLATVAIIGIPLFGGIRIPLAELLMRLGCITVAIIAYAAIFTFFAMMIPNKAVSAIVSLLLVLGLMMFAINSLEILSQTETVVSASFVNGEMILEEVPNPQYPSEKERKIFQAILDILPSGQMYQLAEQAVPNLKLLPLYSAGIFAVFTGTGILLFRKKDLK